MAYVVKDSIEELQKLNPNATVMCFDEHNEVWDTPVIIEVEGDTVYLY